MLFVLLFVISASFQINAQSREKCPDYMWEIEYIPISYLGFEDAPAKITYTSGCCNNEVDGKFPAGIGLRNLSGKTITGVKFQWYLFPAVSLKKDVSAEERSAFLEKFLLTQDEISIVSIKELKPEEELYVEAKVPCEKVSQVIENVKSAKELVIEFVVSEISFSDGSNWKRK